MSDPILFALALLFLLQLKHLFADFYMQTARMLANRARYLHMGRVQHAGLHGVGSLVAMVLVGVPVGLALVVSLIEWAAHFHIDWGKGFWSERMGHSPEDASFWRAFGLDQALHQWTYLVMVWVVLPTT